MRFPSLQVLRFLAALTVVVHHLVMHYDIDMHVFVRWTSDFGVDVFFVISGFIISLTTLRRQNPAQFMLRRFARIVPTYWSLTCCVFFIGLLSPSLLSHASADTVDLLRSLFFLAYPNPAGIYQPVLFVGWTLNYEMFFYVSFALCMAVFTERRWVGIAVIVLFVTLAALHFVDPAANNGVWNFYTSGLILEFCGGIALHRFFHQRDYKPLPYGAALLPIGLLTLMGLNQIELEDARAFVLGIPAILTVAGALSWRPRPSRALQLMVLGGDASYTIYLIHPFVVNGLTKFAMLTLGNGTPALLATGCAAIAASVIIGVAIYRGFELPAYEWLTRRSRRRLPITVSAE